jgi:hypothetical protein
MVKDLDNSLAISVQMVALTCWSPGFATQIIPNLSLCLPLPSLSQTFLLTDSLHTLLLSLLSSHPSLNDPALSLNPLNHLPCSNHLQSLMGGKDPIQMAPSTIIIPPITGMLPTFPPLS